VGCQILILMSGKAVNGTSDNSERNGSVTSSVRGYGKKGRTASASVNGSGKSRYRNYAKKAAALSSVVTQEMIEAERAVLLAEKQVQLEEVLDRHDDLVRSLSFTSKKV
jgi:helicase SWR1